MLRRTLSGSTPNRTWSEPKAFYAAGTNSSKMHDFSNYKQESGCGKREESATINLDEHELPSRFSCTGDVSTHLEAADRSGKSVAASGRARFNRRLFLRSPHHAGVLPPRMQEQAAAPCECTFLSERSGRPSGRLSRL